MQIDGPKTITLQPSSLAEVLDALADRPFRRANPVIQEIFAQLQAKGSPDVNPTSPN